MSQRDPVRTPTRSPGDVRLGFGRASLQDCIITDKAFPDDIDVRCMYVRTHRGATALLVADLCEIWPSTARRWAARVAAALGLEPSAVSVFSTQNHGISLDQADHDRSAADKSFVEAARRAADAPAACEMAAVTIETDDTSVFCRRVPFEGFGAFTFYYGYRLDNAGRADCSHLLTSALCALAEGKTAQVRSLQVTGPDSYRTPPSPRPVPAPLRPPYAADRLLQALLFRTRGGAPLGALVRFPAHPITANLAGADWVSGDYPAYLRRKLEERLGGTAMFLTGPCGDQVPPVAAKSLELARGVGTRLADMVVSKADACRWEPLTRAAWAAPTVSLEVRADYPQSPEAARPRMRKTAAEIQETARAGRLEEAKALTDRYEPLRFAADGAHTAWTGMDLFGQAGKRLDHRLMLLRLNDSFVAGLPGEPFGSYSARLRRESGLGDALIVAEEANGYLSYLPDAAAFGGGGYGPNAALFVPETEELLIDTALAGLRAMRTWS